MAEITQKTNESENKIDLPPVGARRENLVDETSCPMCGQAATAARAPQQKGRTSGVWKMAACCGGMLLLLPVLGLVSAGGLAALAGSALTVAAFLACPIGMYFMMRGMRKQERHASPEPEANDARKELPPSAPGSSA